MRNNEMIQSVAMWPHLKVIYLLAIQTLKAFYGIEAYRERACPPAKIADSMTAWLKKKGDTYKVRKRS